MAQIEVRPEEMKRISSEINNLIEEYQQSVNRLYQLNAEMDALWDGDANNAFNDSFNNDKPKFMNLINMMNEYNQALTVIANNYEDTELKNAETARK